MIHYHGVSNSGSVKDTIRLVKGRHAFVSYANAARLPIVAELSQSFALDNGAYSAWKGKKDFDFDGFVEFVDKWGRHPACDFVVIPDVIDGTEEENDEMLDRFPSRFAHIGAPVWHLHESLDRLKRLIGYRTVCLGSSGEYGSPKTAKWWSRINEAMSVITDDLGRPYCKLHGLRMLDPNVFTKLPLSSADSTNAERNGLYEKRFGNYIPSTRGQRSEVIADRIESHQSSDVFVPINQQLHFL
tara:strand:- start:65 stop:793 length:729 start_codon:yes stop_codon:yes gene_type:complete